MKSQSPEEVEVEVAEGLSDLSAEAVEVAAGTMTRTQIPSLFF